MRVCESFLCESRNAIRGAGENGVRTRRPRPSEGSVAYDSGEEASSEEEEEEEQEAAGARRPFCILSARVL